MVTWPQGVQQVCLGFSRHTMHSLSLTWFPLLTACCLLPKPGKIPSSLKWSAMPSGPIAGCQGFWNMLAGGLDDPCRSWESLLP